jgi:hypothetical protein
MQSFWHKNQEVKGWNVFGEGHGTDKKWQVEVGCRKNQI